MARNHSNADLCYEKNARTCSPCERKECRYWISHQSAVNCTLVAASKGPMTLQEIGEIIGVTRMRVCQLEKKIINEIKDDAEMSRAN